MSDGGAALDPGRRRELIERTTDLIALAGQRFGRSLAPVAVAFDLRGAQAGQYCSGRRCRIRYNPEIAAAHYRDFLRQTVPHEVAHHVVQQCFGQRRPAPHGREWRAVMQLFDAPAERCHDFDLAGVRIRRQQRFDYRCGCRHHQLSATRHNRISRGERRYRCIRCGEELSPCPADTSRL
jgi:SprT protein